MIEQLVTSFNMFFSQIGAWKSSRSRPRSRSRKNRREKGIELGFSNKSLLFYLQLGDLVLYITRSLSFNLNKFLVIFFYFNCYQNKLIEFYLILHLLP